MVDLGWALVGVGCGVILLTATVELLRRAWRDRDPEPLVRIGVASIFVVNAVVAFVNPDDFGDVLRANLIGQHLSDPMVDAAVLAAGVNDLLLGFALLVVRRHRPLIGWMASWLLIVAATKAMNLIW